MANLKHIDLTQGKRFEKILDDEQYRKLNSNNNDRGIRRLKKGEIPHSSITIGNNENLTTWTVTTSSIEDNLVGVINNDFVTYTISIPTITSSIAIDDWVGDWFLNDSSIQLNHIQTSTNLYTNIYDYTSNTVSSKYKWSYLYSDNSDLSIQDRIKNDPFNYDEYIYNTKDLLSRLKKEDTIRIDEYNKKSDIQKRLCQNNPKYIRDMYNDSDILDRLYDTIDIDELSSYSRFHDRQKSIKMEDRLKMHAPFIKRVYVTRMGHSFDSQELNFDMVLAKEHFDACMQSYLNN